MKKYLLAAALWALAVPALAQPPSATPPPSPTDQAFGATILELTQAKVNLLAQVYKLQAELDAAKAKPAEPAPGPQPQPQPQPQPH